MQLLKSSSGRRVPVFEILLGLGILVSSLIKFSWTGVIVGAVLVAAGVASFAVRAVARTRVGTPEISVSSSTLRVGEELSLGYNHTFKRDADVEGALFQLILRETVRYRRGTDLVTVSHDEVAWQHESPGRHVTAGEAISDRHTLQIPPDAMHTFAPSDDNRIEWIIKFQARVTRWPDYSEEHPLTVLPERVR
jgi:hypothetical protein